MVGIPDKLSSTTTAYKLLLVALMAEDIVIVTASGNDAVSLPTSCLLSLNFHLANHVLSFSNTASMM